MIRIKNVVVHYYEFLEKPSVVNVQQNVMTKQILMGISLLIMNLELVTQIVLKKWTSLFSQNKLS